MKKIIGDLELILFAAEEPWKVAGDNGPAYEHMCQNLQVVQSLARDLLAALKGN